MVKSPVEGFSLPSVAGFEIKEAPLAALVQISAFKNGVKTVEKILSDIAQSKLEVGQAVSDDETTLLWAGPETWIFASGKVTPDLMLDHLNTALSTDQAAITDLSHARARLRVTGKKQWTVFNKSCFVDFDETKPGQIIMTTLEQCSVLMHRVSEDMTDVYVMRSFAGALCDALSHSVAEYR